METLQQLWAAFANVLSPTWSYSSEMCKEASAHLHHCRSTSPKMPSGFQEIGLAAKSCENLRCDKGGAVVQLSHICGDTAPLGRRKAKHCSCVENQLWLDLDKVREGPQTHLQRPDLHTHSPTAELGRRVFGCVMVKPLVHVRQRR